MSTKTIRSVLFFAAAIGCAQTQVDLKTQAKGIDFSGAALTKPFRTGSALPGTCTVGEAFYNTSAAAGGNVFTCTSTNTWTVVGTTSSHTHTLAGDVTGDIATTTVGKLQGRLVATTAPNDGQALVWSAGSGSWLPGTVSGSGASSGSDLSDLKAKRISSTVLRLGEGCASTKPCNVQIGDTAYAFIDWVDVTLATGTSGTVRVFVASDGTRQCRVDSITVTTAPSITCPAGTSYPADAIQLGQWTVSASAWDAVGTDWRPLYQRDLYSAGAGLSKTGSQFAIDSAVVGFRAAVPATATTACVSGSYAFDASFLYVCHATDTWKRVAISTW
jgi:hypothetical protein